MQRKRVRIGELARATLLWWLVPAIAIGALAIVAALAQLAPVRSLMYSVF